MQYMRICWLLLILLLAGCATTGTGTRLADVPNLIRLPLLRQATDHTCGVATLQSILYYYGIEYREDRLAAKLHAEDYARTDEIVRVAREEGLTVATRRNLTLPELRGYVDQAIPVMVCMQAWSDTPTLEAYRNDWEDGHWVAVVGYDAANIYVMDPSTLGNYAYVPAEEFDARWHDYDDDITKPYLHFGITITGKPVTYDPEAILRME